MAEIEIAVTKIGANSITRNGEVSLEYIQKIALAGRKMYLLGKYPILVSSGAVAAGMEEFGIEERPKEMKQLRYLSAVGARGLWNLYASEFEKYGMRAVYIPATWRNFETKKERKSIKDMVNMAFEKKDAIIFNNHDALNDDELGFSDNDQLMVAVAKAVGANYCIFVTDHGNMGSGGAKSKEKAIKELKNLGVKVKVGGIAILNDLETLLS